MSTQITKDSLSLRGVKRGTEEAGFTVDSEVILVFGDLHLSSKYEGSHKDYTSNCVDVMERILKIVRAEDKKVTVILLGDVFGVKERNISPQTRFLTIVIEFFKQLNNITEGDTYSVRGNHDFGEFPDFYLFEQLGLIKNPDFIDFKPNGESHEARFHIVNYGYESRDLELAGEGVSNIVSNIVLGHNDYSIEGVTNWYGHDKIIDLRRQSNFIGVDLLISGHIHDPSPEAYECTINNVSDIVLFYPGCPTRVAQRYDDCYYVRFEYQDGATDWNCKTYGLDPAESIFHPKDSDIGLIEVDTEDEERHQRLEDILEEIRTKRIFGGDIVSQIDRVPHASENAKSIAREYLKKSY